MKMRNITRQEVELTVQDPDIELPARYGCRNSYKKIGQRRIRVTHEPFKPDATEIITVAADEVP